MAVARGVHIKRILLHIFGFCSQNKQSQNEIVCLWTFLKRRGSECLDKKLFCFSVRLNNFRAFFLERKRFSPFFCGLSLCSLFVLLFFWDFCLFFFCLKRSKVEEEIMDAFNPTCSITLGNHAAPNDPGYFISPVFLLCELLFLSFLS